MNRNMFLLTGIILAGLIEISDAFIPHDLHVKEIFGVALQVSIVILMIIAGFFADFIVSKKIKRERQVEALHIYNSTLYATQHILNNLLNQMQLVKIEAVNNEAFDKYIIELHDVATDEAIGLIRKLANVQEITGENIKKSVLS